MKIAMKLPGLALARSAGSSSLSPDTAILEDLLDDDVPPAQPAPYQPVRTQVLPPRSFDATGAPGARATPAAGAASTPRSASSAKAAAAAAAAAAALAAPPRASSAPVARRRLPLPLVGAMPVGKQLKIWLPTLLVSVAMAFVFLWLDSRQASNATRWFQQVGDALTHSQRVAKAAPRAIAGDRDAFAQLRDSREIVELSLTQLGRGSDAGSAVSRRLLGELGTITQTWSASSDAARALLSHAELLQSVGIARRELRIAHPQLLSNAQTVAASRVQAGASARDAASAAQLVVLTERIAKEVESLAAPELPIREATEALQHSLVAYRELSDALEAGNERLRPGAATDAALAELKKTMGFLDRPLTTVLANVPKLEQARTAEQRITDDSEKLRTQLDAFRGRLQQGESARGWNLIAAGLFGAVALLSLYGLFRVFLHDSERRAEDAERQRAVAERLEQDAKRTNDQNQAAILRLMNELQEVADGDLTVQATVSEDITGAIADSVNYTVEELRSLVSRINTTAELVSDASSKALVTASSLQAASEQQSREIRETGESVLRMARQIDEVSARALESVQVARQSLGASEDGSRAVNNAIAGMNGIRDQIQDTSKRIKRLGESSQQIGEIVELISDITEQTNVLALNAAIQAASAGEAGRGFTIVAEEVQRLAERSAEATKQISALIRTIQGDTQDAVAAMERSTQGVVEGARLSDEAGRALGEIGRVSTLLAELIEDFSATTSRQAASAGTVAQSIQRILLVTEQTSEGTSQTAGSIRQLSELALELKSSVTRFKVA